MTEESELALRDKSFQKLLKKIGLAPPSNEQVQILMLCTLTYLGAVRARTIVV